MDKQVRGGRNAHTNLLVYYLILISSIIFNIVLITVFFVSKMSASKKYTIWLTGIPASGKTTLAKSITETYQNVFLIDSEEASKKNNTFIIFFTKRKIMRL